MCIEIAGQALGLYDLPSPLALELISISENETWKVESLSGQKWALRLQRPGYQSKRSLESEIAWLLALRSDGMLITPMPVIGSNGEWIQTKSSRNLVLFEWQDGCHPDIHADLRHCFRSLGAITARLHRHSRAWRRPAEFERFTWNFETTLGEAPRWGSWSEGLGMSAARLDLFSRTSALIRQRLVRYGTGPDRFGLAHCDLRLGNLLLHQQGLKVIDFDDCGFSWYMYDAATTLSFYEHLPQAEALLACWLEGYQTVLHLGKDEEEEIPTFLMLRRLLLVGWVASHLETDLARSLGVAYTDQTVDLCAAYLKRFS